MKDAAGNGLCCGDGIGFYAILEGNNTTPIFSGQSFGYEERNQIAYGYVGVDEMNTSKELKLSPNPASNAFNYNVSLEKAGNVKITIYDLNGRLIIRDIIRDLEAGSHTLTQSVRELEGGVYMVNIETENTSRTARLMVE